MLQLLSTITTTKTPPLLNSLHDLVTCYAYAHLVLYTPDGTCLAYHMAINVDIDYIQSRFSTYITKDIDTRHSHLHLKHTPYSGIFT